jgi:hypothetical protein
MIDLGKKNIITFQDSAIYGICHIFDFVDLSGTNFLFVGLNKESTLSKLMKCNKIITNNYNIISDLKPNLFRVDHLIIECGVLYDSERNEKKIRELTDIPITYVIDIKNCSMMPDPSNFDNYYQLKMGKSPVIGFPPQLSDLDKAYIVCDVKNNWEASINDIRISYVRDKKLDDLFGESD